MVIRGLGFTNGTIILNEPEAIYYPGQLMSGNVHFELNEPLTYTAINIVYLGEALVQWSEYQNEMSEGVSRYREVVYKGQEQYFNFVQNLCGGAGLSTLPIGVHSLPFQFQLPFDIPSSFEGEKGNVLYKVTAYLESPGSGRCELGKDFQVVAPINLAALENMQRPLELSFEGLESCSCFCQTSAVDIAVQLPSSVFNLGSTIPVTLKVDHATGLDVYKVQFRVTMRHSYRTQQPRSEYTGAEEELTRLYKDAMLGDSKPQFRCELPLPPTALPNLTRCSIMDTTFYFKVKIERTGCDEDVDDESEIFIGLLPSSDLAELKSTALVQELPKAPIPNPGNPPAFAPVTLQPGAMNVNRSPNMQIKYPQTENLPRPTLIQSDAVSKLQNPYQIGFRVENPAYPHPVTPNRDYPIPLAPVPYPTGQNIGGYALNSSQNNIAPSAPPP